MKHFFYTLLATAAILLCAVCFISCNKDGGPNRNNPVEVTLPAAPFDLIVLDHEHGFNKDSNYVFEGIWKNGHFWFGREKLDTMQLNINPDNAIVLKVSSESAAFQGVNASSSSKCINIVQDGSDHRQYHLEWVAEGESGITLWCGEGSARKEIHFIATSKKEIPMTGIRFRINGEEGISIKTSYLAVSNYTPHSSDEFTLSDYNKACKAFNGTKTQYLRNDRNSGTVKLEIIGPEPLNATKTVLTTAFNAISLQDHYANLNTTENWCFRDWEHNEPSRNVLVWDKMYGLYEENLHCIPGFRWFEPFELERGCANDVNPYNKLAEFGETSGWWCKTSLETIATRFSNNNKYTIYPSDLRERYAELWPQPFCAWFPFTFYEGNKIDFVKTPNNVLADEKTNVFHSFGIYFKPIDDYWNQYQNRHFWMENDPPYWEP